MVKNPVTGDAKETHEYDDIIQRSYPLERTEATKHPRMQIEDRAKIFAPFAALKGYEEAIAAKKKLVVPRIELSEEAKEHLDLQLGRIERILMEGQHPIIKIVYFQADRASYEESGDYIQFTGMVARLDLSSRMLQIVDKRLRLEDICVIEGEDLDRG